MLNEIINVLHAVHFNFDTVLAVFVFFLFFFFFLSALMFFSGPEFQLDHAEILEGKLSSNGAYMQAWPVIRCR